MIGTDVKQGDIFEEVAWNERIWGPGAVHDSMVKRNEPVHVKETKKENQMPKEYGILEVNWKL